MPYRLPLGGGHIKWFIFSVFFVDYLPFSLTSGQTLLVITFSFCRWRWVPMVLYECQWVGCLPWAQARGQWARGCPRDRCRKATVALKRNTACLVDTRCLVGIKCLQDTKCPLVTRCLLVISFHPAIRCLLGSSTCHQVSMVCPRVSMGYPRGTRGYHQGTRGYRRGTRGWAAWRIKAPTALTRCPLHRTWYRNPPCRKAPATPRLPCPNTTLPTHHTPPTQAHTPHTLTPLLTSLRAGKTLISVSILHHLVILLMMETQLERLGWTEWCRTSTDGRLCYFCPKLGLALGVGWRKWMRFKF